MKRLHFSLCNNKAKKNSILLIFQILFFVYNNFFMLNKALERKVIVNRMGRFEDSEYHMQTLEPEFHAYIKQKKQISDKIHDHWKLELNTHVKKKNTN